jgi:small subunit ribosomal protein S2
VVAVVDTNCDPSEVDYVIPGNDDALRAIRLFASKIADSVVEGSQAVTDKQMADLTAGVQYSEAAEATAATPEGVEAAEGAAAPAAEASTIDDSEEVSMEEVLGRGGRRAAENTSA